MTTTINLSLPTELLKRIDREAKFELRSRSELLREAARAYLVREKKWKDLCRYGESRAKALGIRTQEDVQKLINEYRREQRQLQSPRKRR